MLQVPPSLPNFPFQEDVKIVAVDLQAMAPIPGVIQIQGDITKVRLIDYERIVQILNLKW